MKATKENKIIGIGSIVTIYDFEFQEQNTYKMVLGNSLGDDELSSDSVLGRTLLGQTIGDKILVYAEFQYEVEILEVDNSNVSTKTEKEGEVTLTLRSIRGGELSKNFYKFLVDYGYKEFTEKGQPSTVASYVNAIENVCCWENLTWHELAQTITTIVKEYDFGGKHEDSGMLSHRTVYNALVAYYRFARKNRII